MKRRKVLVAEDETVVQMVIQEALAREEIEVVVVDDGIGAMELFEAGEFDLLITDYKMPRMDGIALTEWVRAKEPTLPIILISGDIPQPKFDAIGVNVLLKPFSIFELRDAVKAAINAKPLLPGD